MHGLVGRQAELIVVFGGQQLTSPDCFCTNCDVSVTADNMFCGDGLAFISNRRMEIDLSFTAFGEGWQLGLLGNGKEISKKIVTNCTINELLFAVREKVKAKSING